jgi:hypothetical protein
MYYNRFGEPVSGWVTGARSRKLQELGFCSSDVPSYPQFWGDDMAGWVITNNRKGGPPFGVKTQTPQRQLPG